MKKDASRKKEISKYGIGGLLLLTVLLLTSCTGISTSQNEASEILTVPSADIEASEDAEWTEETVWSGSGFSIADVPPYDGSPSVVIYDNIPFFTPEELVTESFESYSELDELGRCGVAYGCIGRDLMPDGPRDNISEIHPSGWHTVKYDGIDGLYLYNRSHLIAYSLAGENANEKNLITGTRYMNKEGMNPYEIEVADYVLRTGNHVLYRVTPVFLGDNLVASGVEMEAQSVEDDGICFHVYCYNLQPGFAIDYATGRSHRTEEVESPFSVPEGTTYILNTRSMRFHYPDCESVPTINEHNREATDATREELIAAGYQPCGSCNP